MEEIFITSDLLIKTDLIEIVDNYKVLHFDEFPILYIGTNRFGNKIIGSHLDEDDDSNQIFALHTILSNEQFYQFVNKKKTYLQILQESNSISLVVKSFNFEIIKAFDFSFKDLPEEYTPLENSYCPQVLANYSLDFSISLKGLIADMNQALASEVSIIQNNFGEFIEGRIKALKGFEIFPRALLHPYAQGSFRINMELEIKHNSKKTNLFLQLAKFDKYLSDYIRYLGTDFYNDRSIFLSSDEESSEALKALENSMMDLYELAHVNKPENIKEFLKEDIQKSISKFEKITEEVGEHFSSAEIINVTPDSDYTLALLNREFSENFQNAVDEIEISLKGVIEDDEYKDYKIYIYHLNTDNRTGNAFIKSIENEDEMSKPRIKIEGEESLETTKFTESLHLNKWIEVKAKAKKKDDKFKFLNIQFD